MKIPRLLMALTVANLGLLVMLLGRIRSAEAVGAEPVLRGRALEIVDDQGRVRASIKIHPADPAARKPNGRPYPETVMLRLIDPNGRPEVKLGASVEGGGIGFVGATDQTHVLLEATDLETVLKLTNGDGQQQLIKP